MVDQFAYYRDGVLEIKINFPDWFEPSLSVPRSEDEIGDWRISSQLWVHEFCVYNNKQYSFDEWINKMPMEMAIETKLMYG